MEFVQKWRDLESRKVSHQRRPHWYDHHVRLPEGFSLDDDGPAASNTLDDDDADRIVSLENPTESTSYAQALREFFQTIPTAETIEQEAVAGHCLPRTETVWKEVMHFSSSDRPDPQYGLERLRINDLHDHPTTSIHHTSSAAKPGGGGDMTTALLRFEFLRDPPGRGFRADPHRIVLEFASYQTLLDVHTALCELDPDPWWTAQQQTTEGTSTTTASPGYFFIEGNFYTANKGEEYIAPISEWLDSSSPRAAQVRRKNVGLDTNSNDTVYAMHETSLADLSCRVGVRYCHVRNGSVETAVFVTDRRVVPSAEPLRLPLLHDMHSRVPILPACDACGGHSGSMRATSTTCVATGGHRVLCPTCCTALQLDDSKDVRPFAVWRGETDRVGA